MCGINGIYGINDEFRSRDILVHMNARLAHRGPDAQGIFTRGNIALGHRRLSIIDLSEAGRQPMSNTNNTLFLTYNGEIYNYRKLKQECRQYAFKSDTDSEVILALYEKHGTRCFDMLDGMFAIAIWDDVQKKLILARDRMGKKPLYYSYANDVLLFSSEIRGILASGLIKPRISRSGLAEFMKFQTVYSPNTILENVKMLEAGSFAEVSGKLFDIKKYWQIDRTKEKFALTGPYDKVVKQTKELFFTAVEKRMVSDVPLGAFLSGGIDSSAVVAAMSTIQNQKVKTFNVYFEDENFSEAKYANEIAKKYNTEHYGIKLTPTDFLQEIPAALAAMDHPGVDGVNSYVVSGHTKRAGITVALSGLGGDEIFGGYPVFSQIKRLQRYKMVEKVSPKFRKMAAQLFKKRWTENQLKKVQSIAEMKKLDWTAIYPIFRAVYTDAELRDIGLKSLPTNKSIESDGSGFRFLSEISIAECKTYLENVLLRDTDQMSMAHSLEVRVPFLDKDLVEFVFSLPDDFKPIRPPKKLLIDAMGPLLPESIWNRPKMGFVLPWKDWINTDLYQICDENLTFLEELNIFEKSFMEEIRLSLSAAVNDEWYKVWNLVVLGFWMQNNNIKFE